MCWNLRVYWTVLHNLFARFFENAASSLINSQASCCCCCHDLYRCCYRCYDRGCTCGCCCCCGLGGANEPRPKTATQILNELEMPEYSDLMQHRPSTTVEHDYVIVDDIEANYMELEPRKIETELYYRIIDRATAEELLTTGWEDGACIVRPYKDADITIRYIVSVYAQQEFFHLFIRQICGTNLFGIGQEKARELLFHTPSDIIEYYSCNALLCTNKNTSISLVLKPISP